MHNNTTQSIFRFSVIFVVLSMTCSCVSTPYVAKGQHPKTSKEARKPSPSKPATPPETVLPKVHYTMSAYVKQLTLARLMLDTNNQDSPALRSRLLIIEGFANDDEDVLLTEPVIILSYHLKKEKGMRRLMVPFQMSKQIPEFPDFPEVLSALQGMEYTLQDVHPAILMNLSARNVKFPDGDAMQIKAVLDKETDMLLRDKASFSELDEARVQVSLLHFFIHCHMRDGAYLAAENAKQALAVAENNTPSGAINALSVQLDHLESQLHREMPFTLKGF